MKKIFKKLWLCIVVLILIISSLSVPVSAATNVYPQYQTLSGVTMVRCTYYAWQQVYDRLGVAMPNFGDAKNWLDSAARNGYSTGSVATANSVAVYQGGTYGHVAFVTNVNGSKMTINEGGMFNEDGTAALNGTGIRTGATVNSTVGNKKDSYSSYILLGFIYFNSVPQVKISYSPLSEKNSISENNAEVWCKIDKTIGVGIEKIGIRVRKSSDSYSNGWSYFQEPNLSRVDDSWFYLSWNMNSELNLTLTHATQYNYQFYTKIGGSEYWSAEYSFTTTGTHSYGNWNTQKVATCTESGTKTRKCSGCEKTETQTISATEHQYNDVVTLPTCTQQGYTTHTCKTCGEQYVSDYVDPTNIHTYDNDLDTSCNVCGEIREAITGTTGDCTWTLDGTVLTISGNGEMEDYYYSSPTPWGTDITKVVIKYGVTSIGCSAFNNCSSLTSILIPDSVTRIGSGAFAGCSSLTSITIPDNVTSIGFYAFENCSSLTSITIPDSVTIIEGVAFYNTAYYNNSSNWENDVLYIGNHLIAAKNSITSAYTIKNGTKTIATEAFSGCNLLTSVTIPDSVTNIGFYAFSGCSSLTSVTIPDNVTSIGHGAFSDCTSLTSVTVPNSVTMIELFTFFNCSSLASVTIPNSVTNIDYYAFCDCTSLTNVYYYGTKEQAKAIQIGSDNSYLTDATWNYIILGDLNGDEKVDLLDLVKMKKILAGAEQDNTPAPDINNDGDVNSLDVIILMKLLLAPTPKSE